MPASFVRVPPDSTGKKVRTHQRTVGADVTEEHFFHTAHGETSTLANVAASATNVTLQAANQARIGWRVFNDSSIGTLFVKLGATASFTSFSQAIPPRGSWVLDVPFAGIIDGIWDDAGGLAIGGGASSARVTEITPGA